MKLLFSSKVHFHPPPKKKKNASFFTLYNVKILYGVNICSFGVVKLQNLNLHLHSYTCMLLQPVNP